jgi:hypothetical protein
MPGRIWQEVYEFMKILRGHWRTDLKKLLERGQLTFPRPGEGSVVVSVDRIHIPRLHFAPIPFDADLPNRGDEGEGKGSDESPGDRGIGRGKGKPGDMLGPVRKGQDGEGDGDGEEGEGKGAGHGRGGEGINVEIPPEELLELLREMLELPWLQPKGSRKIKTEERKYTDIRRQGARSLIHKRRTMKNTMQRELSGKGDSGPEIEMVPIRDDRRYRLPEVIIKPKTNAVVIYMMDVSGSMGMEERKVVRYFCSLCSFWLSWNYDGLVEEWIIHDGEADRVDRDEFFSTYRGGGTVASSAHGLAIKIIEEEYSPSDWNIYLVYLSDGFNYAEDDVACKKLIREQFLPMVTGADMGGLYAYCEVEVERWWRQPTAGSPPSSVFSPSGNFGKMIVEAFRNEERVSVSMLKKMEHVPDAIKHVFQKKQKQEDYGD